MRIERVLVLTVAACLASFLMVVSTCAQAAQSRDAGRHLLAHRGADSLFVLVSTENDSLREIGRGVVFYSVCSGVRTPVTQQWFDDAYTFNYLILDLDDDGLNEFIVAPKDEAMFHVTIFHPVVHHGSFSILPAFREDALWLPMERPDGSVPPTLEVQLCRNGVRRLIVNFANEDGSHGKLRIGFDTLTHTFRQVK